MKNIISALIIILFFNFTQAQKINYNALWKQVEQFEINGLPKSALKIVNDISYQATKNNDTPQLIKTMLFKGKFALVIEEDAKLNIINDFKNQINTSQFPTKNILESLLANLYWQYFNQNRWTFYNRTKTTVKVDANDFRTWDLETLFNEIHMLYQKSLENGLMLQQDDLSQYDDILQLAKDSKIYRPTLFDFLKEIE